MKKSDLELVNVSARVSTSDSAEHDFFNVHHGFLVSRGVIPNHWNVEDFDLFLPFSTIEYENGVRLSGDPDSFQVTQMNDLKIGENCEPPGLVIKYLTSVVPDTFRMAGIDWTFLVPREDAHTWLTEHFLHPEVVFSGMAKRSDSADNKIQGRGSAHFFDACSESRIHDR